MLLREAALNVALYTRNTGVITPYYRRISHYYANLSTRVLLQTQYKLHGRVPLSPRLYSLGPSGCLHTPSAPPRGCGKEFSVRKDGLITGTRDYMTTGVLTYTDNGIHQQTDQHG